MNNLLFDKINKYRDYQIKFQPKININEFKLEIKNKAYKKKYNSIIQSMAKDEDHIVNEWIVHHILLGFEHVYLYDDNSKIPITEAIKNLPLWILEKVTIYRLEENDSNFFNDIFLTSQYYDATLYENFKSIKQTYFLNYFLINHKHISKWCFFGDVDEFLYIKDDINICDFLEIYNNYNNLYIPWLIYGSSYNIDQPNGLVIENFTLHENLYSDIGKSIAKLSEILFIYDGHQISNVNSYYFNSNKKLFELPIHINHYQINSIKTFIRRKLRSNLGQPNGNLRPYSDFYTFMTQFNNIQTNIMNKYVDPINLILQNKNKVILNDINDYIDAFYCNNKYIYYCESYEILLEMLQSNNLRYCKSNELIHIYNKNSPPDFNVLQYKQLNQDLQNMSDIEAKKHYDLHGHTENRLYKFQNIPDDFSVSLYKELNKDLQFMSDFEAKIHYYLHGHKEDRKYKFDNIPNDFDVSMYKELNKDLLIMTDVEAKIHYNIIGIKENRKYKQNNNFNLIIQSMAKDEDHIINEWIVHHILLGVDHIYLYDDNSKIPITEAIKNLPLWILEKVTIYRLEENDSNFFNDIFLSSQYYDAILYEKEHIVKQKYFLNYFLIDHKNISKWCFFCDVDEFLYIKDDITICNFLEAYANYYRLYIPWLIYGSSYHIDQPKGLVIENFTFHDNKYHNLGKSIVKLAEISFINCVHKIDNKEYYNFDSNKKIFELPIHINHYQINSIKTFLKRKLRPNFGEVYDIMRHHNHFYTFMMLANYIQTNIMNKYVVSINLILQNKDKIVLNDSSDYIDAFYCNNKYIYECESYDMLSEMLQSDNLRYCRKSELIHIYNKNTPIDFDVSMYKELNKDLQIMSDIEAKKHYDLHGYKKKRIYNFKNIPPDFDVSMYKELNKDLQIMTDLEAKIHYCIAGINENRIYKKYNLIIQSMAKDEDHIINEWIVHHILLGVDHIYLYDDNSKIPITEAIKNLPSRILEKVTIYRLEENDSNFFNNIFLSSQYYNSRLYNTSRLNKQVYFLNYFLIDHKYISKWCFFCDVDEFLYIKDDIKISNFLETYDNYDRLYIPWLIYGSSYHIDQPQGLVIENFTFHDNIYHNTGKSIAKLSEILDIGNSHEIFYVNYYNFDPNTKLFELPIHINHYQINSIKTFLKRKLRPNFGEVYDIMRPHDHFYTFMILFNNIQTNIMNKYISSINLILQNKNKIALNDISDYINAFYCNNKYIYECDSYDMLSEMLQSDNLRYCRTNELMHIYSKNTPIDFNVSQYKELNQDLQYMPDIEAKKHYDLYGYKENRKYKFENIPNDFDVLIYKELNKDLQIMTDIEAKIHYDTAGIKEKRIYKDIYFDKEYFSNKYDLSITDRQLYNKYTKDIRQLKNDYFSSYVDNIVVSPDINYIFLVSHDNKLYGASHYIYLLYQYLNNKYKFMNVKIFLCEFEYNIDLYKKYLIGKDNILEYYADPTLLYMLYDKIKPKIVYLNSCNYAISKIYKYIPANIRILHSHEIFEHYLISKETIPDYVVSSLIADQYFQYYKTYPSIQSPFLTDLDNILLLSNESVQMISNQYGNLDLNKITIGMCGQITERKNYELFISISKIYLNYNFLWVGDNKNIFNEYKNIYHIKSTNNPYKYYKQIIDYFILFSKQDPCPYVILENILLESNIITFDKNIYYHHNNKILENIYFRCNDEINFVNCRTMIDKYVTSKKDNNSNNGYKYIAKYFNRPYQIEKKIDKYFCNN